MFLIVRLLHQATSHALCWLVICGDGLPWIEFGHFVWFSYSWSSHRWYLVAVIFRYNLLLKDNVGKIKQTVKLYWCVGMVPRCSKCFFLSLWDSLGRHHLDIAQWPSVSFRWHGHPSLSRYDMATYTRFNSMVTWRILALVNACYRLSAWLGMFGLVETSNAAWIGCSTFDVWLDFFDWLDAELHCLRFHYTPVRNLYKVELDLYWPCLKQTTQTPCLHLQYGSIMINNDQSGSVWIVMIVAPSPDPSRHQRWFQKLSSWVAIGPPSRSEERSVAAWCIRDTLMIVCWIVSPTFLHLGMRQLIILNSLPLAWLAPQLTKKNISKGEQLLSWQVKHSSIDGIAMSVAQVARALWAHQKLAAPSSTKPEKERGRVDVAIASACLSKKWWVVMGLHSCIEPCVFVWICWIVWTGLNRSNRDCSSKIHKYCTRHQTRHFFGVCVWWYL